MNSGLFIRSWRQTQAAIAQHPCAASVYAHGHDDPDYRRSDGEDQVCRAVSPVPGGERKKRREIPRPGENSIQSAGTNFSLTGGGGGGGID